MPTIFRTEGLRFYFYAFEGDPREPIHVHVEREDREAKFWVEPRIRLARNIGFSARDLWRIEAIVRRREVDIRRAWREFFSR